MAKNHQPWPILSTSEFKITNPEKSRIGLSKKKKNPSVIPKISNFDKEIYKFYHWLNLQKSWFLMIEKFFSFHFFDSPSSSVR